MQCRLSSAAARGGLLQVRRAGFSFCCLLLLWSMDPGHLCFSSFGTWAQLRLPGCGVQAQLLWHKGFVALRRVGTS